MATEAERLKILKMLEDGKINAEDAAKLLKTLDEVDNKTAKMPIDGSTTSSPTGGKWFRVRVTDITTGKPRVNIRMPVSVVKSGLRMGAHFSPNIEGMDMHQLKHLIESGEVGQVVDVYDDEDGEHVEVFIE
jgi:SHOCT-like domain